MWQKEITIRVKMRRPEGLRVVRRGGRKYVVAPSAPKPKREPCYDWAKETD